MRAPDTKAPPELFHDFAAVQFQEIEASLAERGVELHAVKVGEFVPGKRQWWSPDEPVKATRPLHDALKSMAFYYGMQVRSRSFSDELPTPIEQANNLRKQLAAIEKAIDPIYRTETAYPRRDLQVGREVPQELLRAIPPKPVLAEMWRYRDELREHIAKLEAMGSRRAQNARAEHNDYWRDCS